MNLSSSDLARDVKEALDQIGYRCRLTPCAASDTARRLIELLPQTPEAMRGYRDIGPSFYRDIERTQSEMPTEFRTEILNLVLVHLAADFEPRFRQAGLPEALLPYYRENIARILARAAAGTRWAESPHNDIFLKDLGILNLVLIPCASHLVFRNSGVPRSLILRQQPTAMLRALRFFALHTGGFRPFLENHVHPAMLDHFHPAGRERCFELVAQLLQCWPDSLGLMGLSWYYDPCVGRISPHLSYLHDAPSHGGALFLPAGTGPDVAGDATAKSVTRRQLVERGEYIPTRYLMAWARKDLLVRYGTLSQKSR